MQGYPERRDLKYELKLFKFENVKVEFLIFNFF